MILSDYRYSISVQFSDEAMLVCLRSLAEHSQARGNRRAVSWPWKKAPTVQTFRFSDPEFREAFRSEAKRLLPRGRWKVIATSDEDPLPVESLIFEPA